MENQKIPETLEEQRDYYLKLYEKWARWQKSEELKMNNEKLWNLLQGVNFENKEENLEDKKFTITFCKLANCDFEVQQILIFPKLVYPFFKQITFSKPIIFLGLNNYYNITFFEETGDLNLINQNPNNIKVDFQNCSFSHITLENFDRGYFSPETNNYLNQMEMEGKLTLINCTWSGLPVLRENLEIEETGRKIWEKNLPISENLQPIKSTLHQYLAWFNDFVEKTENKIIQLRITNNKKSILIEVYSFNGATSNLIEKKFIEFLKISGEEDWQVAKNYITSHGQALQNPFVEYAIASQKQMMDFVIKSKEMENKREGQIFKFIKDFTAQNTPNLHLNIANNNHSMPINFTQNNNIQTLNGNIDTKITEINNNSTDSELKKILQEITNLKSEILNNMKIKDEEKEEVLCDIQVLTENIEKKKFSLGFGS